MKLSTSQLIALAQQTGFRDVRTAVAIALAESSGDPNANAVVVRPMPGFKPEDSRGLWQINVIANPKYRGWNLYDPQVNARAAYEMSRGGVWWRPWSTYLFLKYLIYLPQVALAYKSYETPSELRPSEPTSDGLSPFDDLGTRDEKKIIIGALLLAAALVMLRKT